MSTGTGIEWTSIWPRYRRIAAWHLRNRVGSNDLDDALQDVAVALWRSLARYDQSRKSPSDWVSMIARHVAIDYVRRRTARGRVAHETVHENIVAPARQGIPDGMWAWRGAVARSPAYEPMALVLGRGMSYPQAAAAMGSKENSVKSAVWRGVQRLREAAA